MLVLQQWAQLHTGINEYSNIFVQTEIVQQKTDNPCQVNDESKAESFAPLDYEEIVKQRYEEKKVLKSV